MTTPIHVAQGVSVHAGPSGHLQLPESILLGAGIPPGTELTVRVDGHGSIVLETSQRVHERLLELLSSETPGSRGFVLPSTPSET